MDEVKKKTTGQIITDLNEKEVAPITPYEFVKEATHANYENNLEMCIDYYKKLYGTDFYIEKRVQHEWPLGGVAQPFMKGRRTCPTPTYLQTAIKYHYKSEAIEYLWTIPAKWQFARYKRNALTLSPDDQKTLKTILDFESGELLRKAKKLNGEPETKVNKALDYTSIYKAIS